MSRYSPYLRRLQRLEPEPEYIEPWPPTVGGSLSKVLYDQMIAEGVELPVVARGFTRRMAGPRTTKSNGYDTDTSEALKVWPLTTSVAARLSVTVARA